jgi:hypothetical protein
MSATGGSISPCRPTPDARMPLVDVDLVSTAGSPVTGRLPPTTVEDYGRLTAFLPDVLTGGTGDAPGARPAPRHPAGTGEDPI